MTSQYSFLPSFIYFTKITPPKTDSSKSHLCIPPQATADRTTSSSLVHMMPHLTLKLSLKTFRMFGNVLLELISSSRNEKLKFKNKRFFLFRSHFFVLFYTTLLPHVSCFFSLLSPTYPVYSNAMQSHIVAEFIFEPSF